jgi:hypothetical protein
MCKEESTGTHPMMQSEPMTEMWGLLTEEQKKKSNYSAGSVAKNLNI